MAERFPSPSLIRFLLSKWPLRHVQLGEIRRYIASAAPKESLEFDLTTINRELDTAIEQRGVNATVRAEPLVLCVFDDGQKGKTTLAHLLKCQGLPVFSTDKFIERLRETWHTDRRLRELAWQTVPDCVNEFIRIVETDAALAEKFVVLFFDADHGFSPSAPVNVIEGYLHNDAVVSPVLRLDWALAQHLQEIGCRVWLASTS